MGQQPEVFRISQGIAKYNLNDHYAVLGVPLTADSNQIRKKFLKLAKALHPDVFSRDEQEKELATKYFAKMVSPAYQILNSDRERGEYFATLRLLAQNIKQKNEPFEPQSEVAKKLLKIAHETTYIKAVNEVAALQYQSLSKILDFTTQLSELNMVYLVTQQDLMPLITPPKITTTSGNTSGDTVPKPPADSKAKRNIQMAEVYISKKQWVEALKELQAGEKIDPNSAKLYALIGVVHMNRGVPLMAKK